MAVDSADISLLRANILADREVATKEVVGLIKATARTYDFKIATDPTAKGEKSPVDALASYVTDTNEPKDLRLHTLDLIANMGRFKDVYRDDATGSFKPGWEEESQKAFALSASLSGYSAPDYMARLQDSIKEKFLDGVEPPHGRKPVAVVTAATFGSGKSKALFGDAPQDDSLVKNLVKLGKLEELPIARQKPVPEWMIDTPPGAIGQLNATYLSVDQFGRAIPEKMAFRAFGFKNEAALTYKTMDTVRNHMLDAAYDKGVDLIFEGANCTAFSNKNLTRGTALAARYGQPKGRDYEVHAYVLTADTDTMLEAVEHREKQGTGRPVDKQQMLKNNTLLYEQTFPIIAELAREPDTHVFIFNSNHKANEFSLVAANSNLALPVGFSEPDAGARHHEPSRALTLYDEDTFIANARKAKLTEPAVAQLRALFDTPHEIGGMPDGIRAGSVIEPAKAQRL